MKSDKSFYAFISGGGAKKILPLLILGVLLFIIGSGFVFDGEEQAEEVTVEQRLVEACSRVDGVGRCKVMTTEDSEGKICAVVVICDGADSPEVRLSLTELISSLYGIRTGRIAVLKMN